MLKEIVNTIIKVIHLRSVIGYNSLVFALKNTPVIGRLLPEKLYSTKPLKVIYWVFHVIKEVFKLFIGKIFGLGAIYLASLFLSSEYVELEVAEGVKQSSVFAAFSLSFFIFYALCGVLVNTNLFKNSTEKEYLVFMLRMNPRKLNYSLFAYDIAKIYIGYFIAGLIGAIAGAPFWLWLGIPVLGVLIKFFGAGLTAYNFRRKHEHNRSMRSVNYAVVIKVLLICICVPIVFVVFANGYYLPLPVLLIISAVLCALGVWGIWQLDRFDSSLHRRVLRANEVKTDSASKQDEEEAQKFKHLKASGTVTGDKKGFDYLNALFVRRHRKMLIVKPIIFTMITLSVMALIIASFIISYKEKFGPENTLNMVLHNLKNMLLLRQYEDSLMPLVLDPGTKFFRWIAQKCLLAMIIPISISDNSFKVTQAMYINCDNSLMTFSFFKQREKIIKLFDVRVKQIVKFNLFPSISYGLLADLILFYTGGQDYPFQYLLTLIVPCLISAVYSITGLTLYYLFQPFTTTVKVKSGMYIISRVVQAVIYISIFWIPVNSALLTLILIVFLSLLVLFARKLVYKFAPKTWKVKA